MAGMSLEPAPWSRRAWLGSLAASALAGCAQRPAVGDRIVDIAGRREETRAALLAQLRSADVVLLGEQHDNPHHHARRGELIVELGAGTVVVAEHLDRGRRVGPGADPLARLQAAGFDPGAWQWPLHRTLFEPVLAAGLPVLGGNAPIADVRQVARQGLGSAAAAWRDLLADAPLDPVAEAALDRALVDGHCGQLPPARVPAMRAAQRVRDAALALALAESAGRPAVLVAGNGHVRLDHGVPVLLRRLRPAARVVVVGFGEPDWPLADAPYHHLWLTPAVERADPCAGLRLPASPAPARS